MVDKNQLICDYDEARSELDMVFDTLDEHSLGMAYQKLGVFRAYADECRDQLLNPGPSGKEVAQVFKDIGLI